MARVTGIGDGKQWTLTFRVDDLDDVIERLRGAGIAVEPRPNGRFAELQGPEQNRFHRPRRDRRPGERYGRRVSSSFAGPAEIVAV